MDLDTLLSLGSETRYSRLCSPSLKTGVNSTIDSACGGECDCTFNASSASPKGTLWPSKNTCTWDESLMGCELLSVIRATMRGCAATKSPSMISSSSNVTDMCGWLESSFTKTARETELLVSLSSAWSLSGSTVMKSCRRPCLPTDGQVASTATKLSAAMDWVSNCEPNSLLPATGSDSSYRSETESPAPC